MLTPEQTAMMEAARRNRWCAKLPDGRCFWFNDQDRAERFVAKNGGTVTPPQA